jgi:hypothetical protein
VSDGDGPRGDLGAVAAESGLRCHGGILPDRSGEPTADGIEPLAVLRHEQCRDDAMRTDPRDVTTGERPDAEQCAPGRPGSVSVIHRSTLFELADKPPLLAIGCQSRIVTGSSPLGKPAALVLADRVDLVLRVPPQHVEGVVRDEAPETLSATQPEPKEVVSDHLVQLHRCESLLRVLADVFD